MESSFYKGDWNINKTTHITMDENEIVTPEAEIVEADNTITDTPDAVEEEVESNEVAE